MTVEPGEECEREQQLNEALAEFYRCIDRGQPADQSQFIGRYPHLCPDLQHLLEAAQLIDMMAGGGEQEEANSDAADPNASGNRETVPGPNWLAETAAFDQEIAARRLREDTSWQTLVFGDYEILERIGQGGMGVVYKARQRGLDRLVAVKMIRSAQLASDTDVERFLAEAQAAGKLGHPNIVQVHQVGNVDGQVFYSMEFVAGANLADMARSETLAPKQIARYVRDVSLAIHYAHERGIVHRDIKPANVIVDDSDDRPFITDFGLAKDVTQNQGLTAPGAFLGTPSYMSPEQASGKLGEVGPASDIYSLGTVLYELLTGRPPFQTGSTAKTVLAVIYEEPTAPHSIDDTVDRQLEAICLKCLCKTPSDRYATAGDLAADLTRFMDDQPVLAHPPSVQTRCWHWVRDVPLVAALVGRRVTNPLRSHIYAQWASILGLIALIVVAILLSQKSHEQRPFPRQIRIATGHTQWQYDDFGQALASAMSQRVEVPQEVIETDGAAANRDLLLAGGAEVALLQAGTISSGDLAVVAPLFEEYVYFVARSGRNINTIGDLANKKVVVGLKRSGMRLVAERILDKLSLAVEPVYADFGQLTERTEWDAAIITTGRENSVLRSVLLDHQFVLLSLGADQLDLLVGPEFQRHEIPAGCIGSGSGQTHLVPAGDTHTVTTMTFLVVHHSASDRFVETLLQAIYDDPVLAQAYHIAPASEAAQWPFFPYHPRARRYFDDLSGTRANPESL